jgi:replication factor C large subunit
MKRQDWILLRYYANIISVGVALAKKETYYKYVPYGFPTYVSKMGIMKSKRKELEEKIEKLQEKMHCSKRIIKEELPYLEQFLDL